MVSVTAVNNRFYINYENSNYAITFSQNGGGVISHMIAGLL